MKVEGSLTLLEKEMRDNEMKDINKALQLSPDVPLGKPSPFLSISNSVTSVLPTMLIVY